MYYGIKYTEISLGVEGGRVCLSSKNITLLLPSVKKRILVNIVFVFSNLTYELIQIKKRNIWNLF